MIDIMLIVDRTALLALSKASARVSTSVSSNESASITVSVDINCNSLDYSHCSWLWQVTLICGVSIAWRTNNTTRF
jgi:hypothetical protein